MASSSQWWAKPISRSSMLFRARVLRLRTHIDGTFTFTFDLIPDTSGVQNGKDVEQGQTVGVLENVPLLQAGFGNLSNSSNSPTGIVYIPEEGSRVLVGFDGTSFVIVGFYTGPARTTLTNIAGQDGNTTVDYNPGIEKTANAVGGKSYGKDTDWFFGLSPGDVILGKGLSRVKVTGEAIAIGTSPNNAIILKSDESRIDRCSEIDIRMVGYQKSHRAHHVSAEAGNLHFLRPEAVPAPPGGVITTEIFEATPYAMARKAFLLKQRGHVANGVKDDGRQALLGILNVAEVTSEESAGLFTLERDTVIAPLPAAQIGRIPSSEALVDHVINYDRQVDSDGSWFIRGGNTSRLVGPGQRRAIPLGTLDMSQGYDAITGLFHISVGLKGVPLASLILNGRTGFLSVTATSGMSVMSVGPVSVQAPTVNITAPLVNITGAVNINGPLTTLGPVVSVLGGVPISLATHTHPYNPGPGSSTPTAPPLPG